MGINRDLRSRLTTLMPASAHDTVLGPVPRATIYIHERSQGHLCGPRCLSEREDDPCIGTSGTRRAPRYHHRHRSRTLHGGTLSFCNRVTNTCIYSLADPQFNTLPAGPASLPVAHQVEDALQGAIRIVRYCASSTRVHKMTYELNTEIPTERLIVLPTPSILTLTSWLPGILHRLSASKASLPVPAKG